MQNEAYRISGFTLVAGAVGFLLRWLQDMRIMNEETGLRANAPISWLVILMIAATAAALGVLVMRLKRYDTPQEPEQALVGKTGLFRFIALIPAVLLALSGIYQAIFPEGLWLLMQRLCGLAKVLGAVGLVLVVNAAPNRRQKAVGRRGAYLLIVFSIFWLITTYRTAAAEPEVWRYLVGIFAQCAVMMALFYASGYFFGVPHTLWAIFMCDFAAVLCIMCAIDQNGIAQSMSYGACAAQMLIWGFVLIENLKVRPITPVRPGEIPTD